jgi:hypothetical protein
MDGQLRQLVANLVGNALGAMGSGGTLTIRIMNALGHRKGARPGIRRTTADTRTGIDPENQEGIVSTLCQYKRQHRLWPGALGYFGKCSKTWRFDTGEKQSHTTDYWFGVLGFFGLQASFEDAASSVAAEPTEQTTVFDRQEAPLAFTRIVYDKAH